MGFGFILLLKFGSQCHKSCRHEISSTCHVSVIYTEKDELFTAGTGRKGLNLDLDMNAEEFRSYIFEVYQQLKKRVDINFKMYS